MKTKSKSDCKLCLSMYYKVRTKTVSCIKKHTKKHNSKYLVFPIGEIHPLDIGCDFYNDIIAIYDDKVVVKLENSHKYKIFNLSQLPETQLFGILEAVENKTYTVDKNYK